MSDLIIIIMAGGLGKRMNSTLPKVLHSINGEPMLVKIVKEALTLKPAQILIVVGQYHHIIKTTVQQFIPIIIDETTGDYNIKYIYQEVSLGTGHAIQCCRSSLQFAGPNPKIQPSSRVLILSGDVPLLKASTMQQMVQDMGSAVSCPVRIMTTSLDEPAGYGRIVVDYETTKFQEIIEEKDCTDDQRELTLVNCGIYAFSNYFLCKYLPYLKNDNSQKEYYLTDLISIIRQNEGIDVEMVEIPKNKQYEIMGVNTPQQLYELAEMFSFASDLN